MKYRHRLTQINTDKMKRKNPCKSVSQIEGSHTLYTTRKGEMKATGRTGNRGRATQKRKRVGVGKSVLMMLNHPKTVVPKLPKALYTPSFYWRKRGGINRGSFNNPG